jgi:hypothetical protein
VEWRANPVSEPLLFDPATGPPGGWSEQCSAERAYLTSFAQLGSRALIANLRTRVLGLQSGGRIFPVTINDAEYGDSYVCLPHTAYALYARQELRMVDVGPQRSVLDMLARIGGFMLRAARVNRIVHINNWMLSTNLHSGWSGDDLDAIRRALVARFPDHMIALRCLTPWSDARLMDAASASGWRLAPSRQVYVTNDVAAEWAPRRDSRRDIDLLKHTRYETDSLIELRPGDAGRIAELYAMLYLDRYSNLNPAFTEAFVELTHNAGILQYSGLRAGDGRLAGVAGCLIRGGVLTTPIVGYDTSRPPSEALYRMTSALFAQLAMERGLRMHGSAGAAIFKRNRGARPVVEYTAFFVDHLPLHRRAAIATLQAALDKLVAPIMREKGL